MRKKANNQIKLWLEDTDTIYHTKEQTLHQTVA